jgi:general secretion pathway protein N
VAEDKMTVRPLKTSHAITAALLAIGLIAPAKSQQELPARPVAADARATSDPAREWQRTATIPVTGVSVEARGNPLWSRPLATFTASRERPLFSPTRRAPPRSLAARSLDAPLPAIQRPSLSLVGAIAGETDGVAIFVEDTTKDVVRLRTGESHQGWILRSVQGREATLERDRQTATFGLGSN